MVVYWYLEPLYVSLLLQYLRVQTVNCMGCLFDWGKGSLWWTVLTILSLFAHFFIFAFNLHFNQRLEFLKTVFEKFKVSDLFFSFRNLLLKLLFVFDNLFAFYFIKLVFLLISFQLWDLVFYRLVPGHADLVLWTHLDKFLDGDILVMLIWL